MKIINKILMLGLIALTINLQAQARGKKKAAQGYKVGDTAADILLKNVDGSEVSFASMPDTKGYIVVFTSNTCPFAVMYEDRLIELHNKMAPLGYPVVAINPNDPSVEEGDTYELMQTKAEEKGFPFVYLKDADFSVYKRFGATKTPHVFLLDNELTVQYIGAIDDSAKDAEAVEELYVENAIAALENEEAPDPSFTKAIGCSIKSKNSKGGARRGGPPSADKLLEKMDANGDKQISKSEVSGRLAQDFDRIDTNGDGQLTEAELSAMRPKGKRPGGK